MSSTVPVLIAHRGYPAKFPENTIEGLTAALESGACYLEFDVQITADGVPVLLHDESLLRTAAADISVFACTYLELKHYSAGELARFGDQYAEARIPALADVVELLKQWPLAQAFVEIKRSSLRHFGHQTVLAAVAEVIEPVRDRCIIISFDYTLIEAVKNRHLCRSGWAIKTMDTHAHDLAVQLAPDYLFFSDKLLPPIAEKLWSGPWQWVIYSINDPEQALQLAERGIQFVETDAIGRMLQHTVLKQNQCGNV
jgi:glycerophosphoryl diester phosphodiesterase